MPYSYWIFSPRSNTPKVVGQNGHQLSQVLGSGGDSHPPPYRIERFSLFQLYRHALRQLFKQGILLEGWLPVYLGRSPLASVLVCLITTAKENMFTRRLSVCLLAGLGLLQELLANFGDSFGWVQCARTY